MRVIGANKIWLFAGKRLILERDSSWAHRETHFVPPSNRTWQLKHVAAFDSERT